MSDREVRLTGYLGGWPLWTIEDEPSVAADWPQLSNELVRDLENWNARWINTSDRLSRREERALAKTLVREAQELATRVQDELGDTYRVKLDL